MTCFFLSPFHHPFHCVLHHLFAEGEGMCVCAREERLRVGCGCRCVRERKEIKAIIQYHKPCRLVSAHAIPNIFLMPLAKTTS